MKDRVDLSRYEVCAGIPRSGTTMFLRGMAGLPPGDPSSQLDFGCFLKTHSFRPTEFNGIKRAIFLFGDPIASVLSTKARRYDAQHFLNCGAVGLDPATTDILKSDALNYERMFDAWMQRQDFDLICARYETLHDNIESIEGFFGRHIFIPVRKERQTVVSPENPQVEQIARTYSTLIAKVEAAPDLAVFRGSGHARRPSRAARIDATAAPAVAKQVNECPLCSHQGDFIAFRGRPAEQCPSCKSLLRTRAMYLVLRALDLLPKADAPRPLRIAHFAPEPALYSALRRNPEVVEYTAFDVEPERYLFAGSAVVRADICNLEDSIGAETFDLVLHNHVLEHVPCPLDQAVGQLRRIMAPGATQLFSVPMRKGKFRENLDAALSPDQRRAEFAQEDHMRLFGSDDVRTQIGQLYETEDQVAWLPALISKEEAARYSVVSTYEIQARGEVDGATIFRTRRQPV